MQISKITVTFSAQVLKTEFDVKNFKTTVILCMHMVR